MKKKSKRKLEKKNMEFHRVVMRFQVAAQWVYILIFFFSCMFLHIMLTIVRNIVDVIFKVII